MPPPVRGTQDRIMAAATQVFAEKGFAGARVDDIARRARVNKATLYYHLGDKQAIYGRVLHRVFARATERFTTTIGSGQTPSQKLRAFVRSVTATIQEHPEIPSIMIHEQASGGRNMPPEVVADLERILGFIGAILDEGVRRKVFRPVDPLLVHMMIVGTIIFYQRSTAVIRRHRIAGTTPADRLDGAVGRQIEELVLKAVGGGGDANPSTEP